MTDNHQRTHPGSGNVFSFFPVHPPLIISSEDRSDRHDYSHPSFHTHREERASQQRYSHSDRPRHTQYHSHRYSESEVSSRRKGKRRKKKFNNNNRTGFRLLGLHMIVPTRPAVMSRLIESMVVEILQIGATALNIVRFEGRKDLIGRYEHYIYPYPINLTYFFFLIGRTTRISS